MWLRERSNRERAWLVAKGDQSEEVWRVKFPSLGEILRFPKSLSEPIRQLFSKADTRTLNLFFNLR